MSCISMNFTTYQTSVPEILGRLNASAILAQQSAILIKPNLVNSSPHPVTTAVACCEAVVQYIQACTPNAEIVIAEGCGDCARSTPEISPPFYMIGLYRRGVVPTRNRSCCSNRSPLRLGSTVESRAGRARDRQPVGRLL